MIGLLEVTQNILQNLFRTASAYHLLRSKWAIWIRLGIICKPVKTLLKYIYHRRVKFIFLIVNIGTALI